MSDSARERSGALPHLSAHDIKDKLLALYRRGRRHHLFAFHGTGDPEELHLPEHGKVRVVPVRSELELRDKLPPLQDAHERIAFLVPWTHDIPVDIAGRFAQGGRVERIGKDARLRRRFGVAALEDEVRRSPLAEHLLGASAERVLPVGDAMLTVDAMWAAWLGGQWGVPTRGGLALDTLLGFGTLDVRGPQWAAVHGDRSSVHQALLAHLRERLGGAGPLIWTAWVQGRGSAALELAIVLEVLADESDQTIRYWVRTEIRKWLPGLEEGPAHEVARALGRAAAGALRYVERHADADHVRRLTQAADELVDDAAIRRALAASTRLPSAWQGRLDALGEALARGAAEPTVAAALAAEEAWHVVERHAKARDHDQSDVLARAEMAVRLLRWLVARTDRRVEPSPQAHGEMEALARWYAEEGGFLDWARRAARGSTERAFGRGIQAIVQAVDDVRRDLDRRFARGICAWTEAGQPATQVLPIARAVERVAARFLEGAPDRRLLVLLLDGMAWMQAVQLLHDLDLRGWAPLDWHSVREHRVGEGLYPAMLAGLPTVTEVSRSAFFGGALPEPGKRLDTQKDPELWAAHRSAMPFVPAHDRPRLLLRAEGHTKAGGASPEALSLVADPERRLVAVVVNAIDDSLKASHALRVRWAAEAIKSLPELLDQARDHGRAVLLVSDHGHVTSDLLGRRAPRTTGGGARWRPWPSPNDPVDDDEIALPAKKGQVYAPRGAHGVVLLADDTTCYAGSTHAGQHGGASLSEVVAPCVLVGHDDNAHRRFEHDREQRLRRPVEPDWWHSMIRPPREAEEAATVETPATSPRRKPKPVDERQLGLPTIPVAPPAPPTPAPPPKPAASPFGSSDLLAARAPDAVLRQQVADAVDLLISRGGVMSTEAFAAAMGLRSFRVNGYVSTFSEVLNIDGYEVLRLDHTSKQIHLDREKLAQLFEVKA